MRSLCFSHTYIHAPGPVEFSATIARVRHPHSMTSPSTDPSRGPSLAQALDNEAIARRWLAAFNAYDVDALVALYADEATHSSPKIRALHPDTGGKLVGKAALGKWWRDANARLPGLHYVLTALTANDDRVFVEYLRHAPNESAMPIAEVFDVVAGKIVASRVYHG